MPRDVLMLFLVVALGAGIALAVGLPLGWSNGALGTAVILCSVLASVIYQLIEEPESKRSEQRGGRHRTRPSA